MSVHQLACLTDRVGAIGSLYMTSYFTPRLAALVLFPSDATTVPSATPKFFLPSIFAYPCRFTRQRALYLALERRNVLTLLASTQRHKKTMQVVWRESFDEIIHSLYTYRRKAQKPILSSPCSNHKRYTYNNPSGSVSPHYFADLCASRSVRDLSLIVN
jgi:hypothetical protein